MLTAVLVSGFVYNVRLSVRLTLVLLAWNTPPPTLCHLFKHIHFGHFFPPLETEIHPIFTPHLCCVPCFWLLYLWCDADSPLLCNHKCTLIFPTSWVIAQSDNYNSCRSPDWLTSDLWPPAGHLNWLMYNERASLKESCFKAREDEALMLEGSNLISWFNW